MKQDDNALKRIVSRFERGWQAEAEIAIKRMYELLNQGVKVEQALIRLRQEHPALFNILGVREAMVEAAAYGYGIMPSVLTSADRVAVAKVLETPWSADGMRLSEKLHAFDDVLYRNIVNTVTEQMRKNATALQMSRELYEGYRSNKDVLRRNRFSEDERLPKYINQVKRLQGATAENSREVRQAAANISRLARNGAPNRALKAGYSKLLQAVEGNNQKAIENAIYVAVNEKSRYIAERIARTEMARAYADGFLSKHYNDSDVVGFEYQLGTRHPVFDVCDMYATCNMFNLGKGVYPKEQMPLVPAHPHCLCTYHVLYRGQIDLSKQRNQQTTAITKWLNDLPEDKAIKVLGRKGYDAFKGAESSMEQSKGQASRKYRDASRKAVQQAYIRNYEGLGHPQYRSIDVFADVIAKASSKDGSPKYAAENVGGERFSSFYLQLHNEAKPGERPTPEYQENLQPTNNYLEAIANYLRQPYNKNRGATGENRFYDDNGIEIWPFDNGARNGKETPVSLAAGTLIDRFGDNGGRFSSPFGTSVEGRALSRRSRSDDTEYHVYRVTEGHTLSCYESIATPWFEQRGLAVQYRTAKKMGVLIDEGVIVDVTEEYIRFKPIAKKG